MAKSRKCPICGVRFIPNSVNHKYCCLACRCVADRNKRDREEKQKKIDRIAFINRRAKEHGMSYGKYVAMIERPNKIKKGE